MNQILLTEEPNKNNNNKNYNRTNSGDLKKIIIFFAVVIIVFGISLSGIYGYKVFKNKKGQTVEVSKPNVSVTQVEDSIDVTITASSDVGIDKIIYSWNNDEEVVKEIYGRKSQEENIEAPYGENKLKVKVIDINKEEIETEQDITINIERPKIETAIVENGKLKITATSEIPMDYITYRWNEEEEVKVEAEGDLSTSIETIIDVKRGNNEITITAVSSNKGKETISKIFNGVNKPVIDLYKDGSRLYMKISHDLGIKKIEFNINGKIYTYDENAGAYNPDKKEIEYYFNLEEGENTVIVTATSIENTEEVRRGKCSYTAE